ncbi:hypothetical protein ALO92_101516 [Pseudomonas congelans]|uniref:Uncharacterized protein n=1 Tax=Pseudomonas congelans TaxID=200452 RepID=A0A0P9MJ17_9PSED|nr:hypothetical protein ALO92_101516 [Pseudomonas congelans]
MFHGVGPEHVEACEINQWRVHIRLSGADIIPPILRLTACLRYMPLIGRNTISRRLRWNLYG